MTFTDAANAILNAPGVESGLVQQTYAKDYFPHTRAPGESKFAMRTTERTTFRVFICTGKDRTDNPIEGKINHEASGDDLPKAAREVFEKCGLSIPDSLKPKPAYKPTK